MTVGGGLHLASESGAYARPTMPSHAESPQRPARWTSMLHGAATENAVVLIVQQYLRTWTPSELEAMPLLVDAERLASGQDVSNLAVELAHAELKFAGDEKTAEALKEITAVVREAAARFPRFSLDAKVLGGGK